MGGAGPTGEVSRGLLVPALQSPFEGISHKLFFPLNLPCFALCVMVMFLPPSIHSPHSLKIVFWFLGGIIHVGSCGWGGTRWQGDTWPRSDQSAHCILLVTTGPVGRHMTQASWVKLHYGILLKALRRNSHRVSKLVEWKLGAADGHFCHCLGIASLRMKGIQREAEPRDGKKKRLRDND